MSNPSDSSKLLNPIALEIWEHYFGDLAFKLADGKAPLIGREFCQYVGSLIEAHSLQERIDELNIHKHLLNVNDADEGWVSEAIDTRIKQLEATKEAV